MSKHTKTAAIGLVAAGALVLGGCSLGNSTEAEGHGTVKGKVTPHTIKAAMKNADCHKTGDVFGTDHMGAIGDLGVTDIQGCINDEGTQLAFGTVKKHKQVKKVMDAFADSEDVNGVWGADIDGRKLFGLAQSKKEMKAITGEMNVEEVEKADPPKTSKSDETSESKESSKPKETSESKSDESDEPETSDEDQSVPLKGNSTYKFDDGVTVELVEGVPHTASASDAEFEDSLHPGDKYMVYEFKVTNGTKKPLDTMATLDAHYGNKGKSAEEVATEAVGDGEMGKIQPGHSATEQRGVAVNPQAKKVVLDFDPDMEHEVSFVGK